jgi:hypothetical protein
MRLKAGFKSALAGSVCDAWVVIAFGRSPAMIADMYITTISSDMGREVSVNQPVTLSQSIPG